MSSPHQLTLMGVTPQVSKLSYKSVILTVDHTQAIAPQVVQKVVHSTETIEEALLSNINYYKEQHLLHSIETIKQFQELAKANLPAIAYRTPENLQIILSQDAFDAQFSRSEDLLDCHQYILDTVGQVISAAEKSAGAVIPLIVFDWVPASEIEEVTQEESEEA